MNYNILSHRSINHSTCTLNTSFTSTQDFNLYHAIWHAYLIPSLTAIRSYNFVSDLRPINLGIRKYPLSIQMAMRHQNHFRPYSDINNPTCIYSTPVLQYLLVTTDDRPCLPISKFRGDHSDKLYTPSTILTPRQQMFDRLAPVPTTNMVHDIMPRWYDPHEGAMVWSFILKDMANRAPFETFSHPLLRVAPLWCWPQSYKHGIFYRRSEFADVNVMNTVITTLRMKALEVSLDYQELFENLMEEHFIVPGQPTYESFVFRYLSSLNIYDLSYFMFITAQIHETDGLFDYLDFDEFGDWHHDQEGWLVPPCFLCHGDNCIFCCIMNDDRVYRFPFHDDYVPEPFQLVLPLQLVRSTNATPAPHLNRRAILFREPYLLINQPKLKSTRFGKDKKSRAKANKNPLGKSERRLQAQHHKRIKDQKVKKSREAATSKSNDVLYGEFASCLPQSGDVFQSSLGLYDLLVSKEASSIALHIYNSYRCIMSGDHFGLAANTLKFITDSGYQVAQFPGDMMRVVGFLSDMIADYYASFVSAQAVSDTQSTSSTSWIETMQQLFTTAINCDFDTPVDNPLIKKFLKLFAIICSAPLMISFGLFPSKVEFDKWYSNSVADTMTKLSFGAAICAFLAEFARTGIPYLLGDLKWDDMSFSSRTFALQDKFNLYCINKADSAYMMSLGLFDESGIPTVSIVGYVQTMQVEANDLQQKALRSPHNRAYINVITALQRALTSELGKAKAYLQSCKSKAQPYCIAIVGPSSVQKSALNAVIQTALWEISAPPGEEDVPFTPELCATVNPTVNFQDNINGSTRHISIDDMGKYNINLQENPLANSIMEYVNTDTSLIDRSAVEEKGLHFQRHTLVTVTANDYTMGQYELHNYPIAAYRRIELLISLEVIGKHNPVLGVSHEKFIHPMIIHRNKRYYIEVYAPGMTPAEVFIENLKDHTVRSARSVPVFKQDLTNTYSFDEMMLFLHENASTYYARQNEIAAFSDKLRFQGNCDKCKVSSLICKCAYESSLSLTVAHPQSLPQPFVERNDTVAYVSLTLFGMLAFLSWFWYFVYVVFWWYWHKSYIYDMFVRTAVDMIVPDHQQEKFYTPIQLLFVSRCELFYATTHWHFVTSFVKPIVDNVIRRYSAPLVTKVMLLSAQKRAHQVLTKYHGEILCGILAAATLFSWTKLRSWLAMVPKQPQALGDPISNATRTRAARLNISYSAGWQPSMDNPTTRPTPAKELFVTQFPKLHNPQVLSYERILVNCMRHVTLSNAATDSTSLHGIVVDQCVLMMPFHALAAIKYPDIITVQVHGLEENRRNESGAFQLSKDRIVQLANEDGKLIDMMLIPLSTNIIGCKSLLPLFADWRDMTNFVDHGKTYRLAKDRKSIEMHDTAIVYDARPLSKELSDFVGFTYDNHNPGPGTCGTVLVKAGLESFTIIGLHQYGGINNVTEAHCQYISKQHILAGLAVIKDKHLGLNFSNTSLFGGRPLVTAQGLVHNSMLHHISNGYGRNVATAMELRNKEPSNSMVPTKIFNFVNSEVKTIPMVLKSNVIDGRFISPLLDGAKECMSSPTHFNLSIMNYALKSITDGWLFIIPSHELAKVQPLSVEQNIKGLPGICKGMNLKTAAGSGFKGAKRGYVDGTYEADMNFTDDIFDCIDEIEKSWHARDSAQFISKLCPKNECRAANKKARIFYAASMPFIAMWRMLLTPFFELLINYRGETEYAVGANCGHPDEVKGIIDQLLKYGIDIKDQKFLDADFAKYDTSNGTLIYIMWTIYDFIELHCPLYGDHALWALRQMIKEFPNLLRSVNGDLFLCTLNNPSGWVGTTMVNCMGVSVYFRMAHAICWAEHKYSGLLSSDVATGYNIDWDTILEDIPMFETCMNIVNFGDDLIGSITPRGTVHLKPEFLTEAFILLNIVVTAGDKSPKIKMVHLEDLEFLKRSFVYDGSIKKWKMPLHRASIFKSLAYRDSQSVLSESAHLITVMEQSRLQMFLRGRDEFDAHDILLYECLAWLDHDPMFSNISSLVKFPAYSEIENTYLDGVFFDDSL